MKLRQNLLLAGIAFFGLLAQSTSAQTVEIIGKDGSAPIQGTLIGARDDHFVVRTNIGVVSFERSAVICRGDACPVELAAQSDMSITAPAELANIFIPLLAEGFAESQESEARLLDSEGFPVDERAGIEAQVRNNAINENKDLNVQLITGDGEETANIVVQSATGDRLFTHLTTGKSPIVFSEKSANVATVRAVRASGGGNIRSFQQERTVAVDGYVVVTHPRNDVKSMSLEQISAVISGQIVNWSEFGGSDTPINVYSFKPETEAFHHIDDLILKPYKATLTQKARVIQSNRELTVAIENDPNGIGIVSYSSVRNTRPIAIENECGMIIEPSAFNIKTEEYTLQNRITAYSRTEQNKFASDFLAFLDGPSLDNLVGKSGLISLAISEENKSEAHTRLMHAVESSTREIASQSLKQFVLDALNTKRMSTTFRFAPGSSRLDNKARRDLARVLRYVEDANIKQLVLAGFADANGAYRTNLTLSESRANAVYQQLQAADSTNLLENVKVEIRGYGELGPVACNTSSDGRATNRRVEIWAN